MSLSIVLDQAGAAPGRPPTYRPGSTISGRLILALTRDEAVASVDMDFGGSCRVRIREHDQGITTRYDSTGSYFSQHLSLYADGKYTHKAGTYAWSFTFTIPRNCSPKSFRARTSESTSAKNFEGDIFSATRPWRGTPLGGLQGQPLPDCFSYSKSLSLVEVEGSVQYRLFATVTRPPSSSFFSQKALKAVETVIIKSGRPPLPHGLSQQTQTHQSCHTISSMRLLPPTAGRNLSLRETINSRLKPSPKPHCLFDVAVKTPRYLVPSAEIADTLPFSITVHRIRPLHLDKATEELATPPLRLSKISLWVRARTLMRDNGKPATEHAVDYEDRIQIDQRREMDIALPVNDDSSLPVIKGVKYCHAPESVDIGKLLDLRLRPDLLAPTFSTYNICRAYELGFKLQLDCLGETMDISADHLHVVVLPEALSGDSSIAERGRDPNGQLLTPPDSPGDLEPLPRYQRHGPEGRLPAFQP